MLQELGEEQPPREIWKEYKVEVKGELGCFLYLLILFKILP